MKKIVLLAFLATLGFSDTGILTKVVDGDTLYFKKDNSRKVVKCRIEYIDTPESMINKKLKKDIKLCGGAVKEKDMKAAGKSATRAAKRVLEIGERYNYSVSGKDRYGRSICVVQLKDGETFNETMLKEGYAVAFRHYMTWSEKIHYVSVEKKAQQLHKGLWGSFPQEMMCMDKARQN